MMSANPPAQSALSPFFSSVCPQCRAHTRRSKAERKLTSCPSVNLLTSSSMPTPAFATLVSSSSATRLGGKRAIEPIRNIKHLSDIEICSNDIPRRGFVHASHSASNPTAVSCNMSGRNASKSSLQASTSVGMRYTVTRVREVGAMTRTRGVSFVRVEVVYEPCSRLRRYTAVPAERTMAQM
eukprot:3852426-Pyramimonas_sp.AAC.2